MYGYVALNWDAADDLGARAATVIEERMRAANEPWELVFADSGLRVLQRGANRATHGSRGLADWGVVLGTIFRARSGAQSKPERTTFAQKTAQDIRSTDGRYLVEQFWGRYVAFVRGADNRLRVIRDPTGALPCFYGQADHVTVFFSHLEDYLRLVAAQLTVNWEHVREYLQYMQMASRQTGFRQISQVLAGECWTYESSRSEPVFLWNPVSIAAGAAMEDPAIARDELRSTVEFCVDAWASCYPGILHSLSGGLDSSIVLACLSSSSTHPRVTCFTAYTEGSDGDERPFAQMAASLANCQLAEFAHQPPADLSTVFPEQRYASPAMLSLRLAVEDMRANLARTQNCGAIFSGQGGDHLFQRRRDDSIATEFLDRHGLKPGFGRVVAECSRMLRKPAYRVLLHAARLKLFPGPVDPYVIQNAPAFLRAGAPDALRTGHAWHPWVESATHLPRAMLYRIFDIVDCQHFYAHTCEYADLVHPLISQPLFECSLRIPSYVLTSGGADRGLARQAFSEKIPAAIAARTIKGGVDAYWYDLVITNLKFLRPFLLDGHLEAAGLIDRREMSNLLTEQHLVRAVQSLPVLLCCLIAEGWLRTAGSVPIRQLPDDAARPSQQHQRQHVATGAGYQRFDN
jgi:asparagine synthase (glutamine-hydrolysing)